MPRILFLFSALALAAAILAKGWFGKRVQTAHRARHCQPDATRWKEALGEDAPLHAGEVSVVELGQALRKAALTHWEQDDPIASRARNAARRFGLAVPPLTILVAIFAVIMLRIQVFPALAIILAATALACAVGLLSIGSELRAVARVSRIIRERRVFRRSDDEDAVIECAAAEVWMKALPPITRFIS